MSRAASAVLSETAVVLFLLLSFPALHGQRPDYTFNWTSDDFGSEAPPFFKRLTLQSGTLLQAGDGRKGRISLKATASSGLSKATGTMPLFSGLYRISDNLWLGGLLSGYRAGDDVILLSGYGGLLSGYRAGDDVIILSGYGAEILPGELSDETRGWSVEVSRRAVEGAEAFTFKTVGVALSRRINFGRALLHYGLGFAFYDVIVHNKSEADDGIPRRHEGQVNLLSGGIEQPVGEFSVGLAANASRQGAAVMVNISKKIDE